MKTTIFIATILIAATCCASAQNSSKPQMEEIQKQDTVLIMKEGKVWMWKESQKEEINTEVLVVGTRVKPDGSLIFKDGTADKMQEGDVIMSDGKLVRAVIKAGLDKRKEE